MARQITGLDDWQWHGFFRIGNATVGLSPKNGACAAKLQRGAVFRALFAPCGEIQKGGKS